MIVVLGAGLAGLSTSFHLGHKCEIFEKKSHAGGHIYSQHINGFVWDEGPHISFTKHQYVRTLFEESCEFLEYPVFPTNYYRGSWIDHPAQVNLHALPEPVRTECLDSFIASREGISDGLVPKNYQEWLEMAFGSRFANEFPRVYTRKYWTTEPENLTTDWVGERVFYPRVEDVREGYFAALKESKHYQSSVRYPKTGGYFSYANKLRDGARIHYEKDVLSIDLQNKLITFADGSTQKYSRLINTIALPEFIIKTNPPAAVKSAAEQLACSEVLLVNVVLKHPPTRKNQWLYVYDHDKYSTRVSYTDLFSPHNGVKGKSGIQVEVYFSKYRPQSEPLSDIISAVCNELVEMGLAKSVSDIDEVNTQKIKYANVIFDHARKSALDMILNYLEKWGLKRESQDLLPMTDWNKKLEQEEACGDIVLAGRFGEWKYYWTDDCVMRGLDISRNINKTI